MYGIATLVATDDVEVGCGWHGDWRWFWMRCKSGPTYEIHMGFGFGVWVGCGWIR